MKKGIGICIAIVFLIPALGQITPAYNVNNPPEKPTVTGPTSGEAGTSYTYTAVSTDPDGDKITYCFDWGDGTEFCTDLYNSGQQASISHTWESEGDYTITVKATDEHGAESEAATLKVSMPLAISKKPFYISSYEGKLRVYIVELASRWETRDGDPYHFGFLDFAFNDALNIPYGDTHVENIAWNATDAGYTNVSESNIMAIATVFNPQVHEGYADPPSGSPFNAYYVDATAAAKPGETGQNVKNEEFTHTVFCEEGTVTFCTSCPISDNTLFNIYESKDYPFYFVSLVADKNTVARSRIDEYNSAGFPTAFFDGGRKVINVASTNESLYRNAISYCANQNVHDLDLTLSVEWQRNGVIQIEVSITNNEESNNPPEKPTVTGQTSGEAGTSYTYTAVSTDSDGDKISYCFNWGDGTEFCTDLYNSGQQASASHTWESEGDYAITVKATDEHGAESEPTTLKVSIPLGYINTPSVNVVKPRNGIYIFDLKVLPIIGQIVIGDVTVEARASNDVERVEFLLQESCGCGLKVMHVDTSSPFTWEWNTDYNDDEVIDEGIIQLTVRAYDGEWNGSKDSVTMLKLG